MSSLYWNQQIAVKSTDGLHYYKDISLFFLQEELLCFAKTLSSS